MPIVGVVSRKDESVSDRIFKMISAVTHFEKSTVGMASEDEVIVNDKIESFDLSVIRATSAIGCCDSIEKGERFPQPIVDCNGSTKIVFTGRIYNVDELMEHMRFHKFKTKDDYKTLFHLIEDEERTKNKDIFESVSNILSRLYGAYALAVLRKKKIILTRDLLGVEPLYFGKNQDYFAFASERKALWAIGIREVTSFPPGHVAVIEQDGYILSKVLTLKKPEIIDISLEDASQRLKVTLQEAFKMFLGDIDEVGVSFSGGIDSSLVAKISEDMGIGTTLYTAGIEGSYDIDIAEKSAAELGLKHHVHPINLDEVDWYVYKVVYAVEEADLMKIGVGIPLYISAELANNCDVRLLLSGQGSDELFGGYAKYTCTIKDHNYEKLGEEMWNDVLRLAEVNLQRDAPIFMMNNIEYYSPFLDLNMISLAMSLPTQLKVKDSTDKLRKHVLRKTAKLFGLPDSITNLQKKAAQYGSGSNRALEKTAKLKGYANSIEYIKGVFREIFRDIS